MLNGGKEHMIEGNIGQRRAGGVHANASCAVCKRLQGVLKTQRLACKVVDNVLVVNKTASYILFVSVLRSTRLA